MNQIKLIFLNKHIKIIRVTNEREINDVRKYFYLMSLDLNRFCVCVCGGISYFFVLEFTVKQKKKPISRLCGVISREFCLKHAFIAVFNGYCIVDRPWLMCANNDISRQNTNESLMSPCNLKLIHPDACSHTHIQRNSFQRTS